jgi:hypothetical protein
MLNSVLRRCNEGMMSFFDDVAVVDHKGNTHNVPILYGTVEKAKDWGFQLSDAFLDPKDLKMFFLLQRFPLLCLELVESDFESENPKLTYHLHALATLQEDMNQVVEQVMLKFSVERKHYKLESVISGEEINTHSCKIKHWNFIVTLEGLGAEVE